MATDLDSIVFNILETSVARIREIFELSDGIANIFRLLALKMTYLIHTVSWSCILPAAETLERNHWGVGVDKKSDYWQVPLVFSFSGCQLDLKIENLELLLGFLLDYFMHMYV